jgi:hypothetical protein
MLASGTQFAGSNSAEAQHAFGGEVKSSQICGMLENPSNDVAKLIISLPQFHLSLLGVSRVGGIWRRKREFLKPGSCNKSEWMRYLWGRQEEEDALVQ